MYLTGLKNPLPPIGNSVLPSTKSSLELGDLARNGKSKQQEKQETEVPVLVSTRIYLAIFHIYQGNTDP